MKHTKKNITIKFLLSLFALLFFINIPLKVQAEVQNSTIQKYFENRLPSYDKRYTSFLLSLYLIKANNAKKLIETGTSRNGDANFFGDGGSSIIYSHFAHENNLKFWSVDIDPIAIGNSRNATIEYHDASSFVTEDSISFLEKFKEPIDFLYLDSYDFDYNNPSPSQMHHLKEIIAAYPKLHSKSIVMIDDCDLPHGGKGKLIIDYLKSKDWKVIYNGYQVILVP